MKAFFSLVILGVAIALVNSKATKEVSEKLRAAVAKCTKEHHLDLTTVEEYVKFHKLPETEHGKCAVFCYFKEMGYVTDGKFNDANVESTNKLKWDNETEAAKATEVYHTCLKETSLTDVTLDCEAAVKMLSCLKTHSEKHSLPLPELHKDE
ncbi:uncharacterized protein LOC106665300 [Cimex lectularius]|uniref:Odorant binding protein n=1 Tax=Cimex lectularius TaxID=79782 RepID=A0A8I6RPC7_CIMLE|nr:uncharacterized protein LOC106665300 [Cimex lectularius]